MLCNSRHLRAVSTLSVSLQHTSRSAPFLSVYSAPLGQHPSCQFTAHLSVSTLSVSLQRTSRSAPVLSVYSAPLGQHPSCQFTAHLSVSTLPVSLQRTSRSAPFLSVYSTPLGQHPSCQFTAHLLGKRNSCLMTPGDSLFVPSCLPALRDIVDADMDVPTQTKSCSADRQLHV